MLAQVRTPVESPTDSPEGAFALMGSSVEPLVEGGDAAGGYELVRTTVGAGGRSPLHTMSTDKVFVVAAGRVVVTLDRDDHDLPAGSVVLVPAGTVHRYRNDGQDPALLVVLTSGPGHVDFLRGMSRLTAGGPPDAGELAEHTAAHGVSILPPR